MARVRGASGGVPARTAWSPGPAAETILLYVYVNVNYAIGGPDWPAPAQAGWGCTGEGDRGAA